MPKRVRNKIRMADWDGRHPWQLGTGSDDEAWCYYSSSGALTVCLYRPWEPDPTKRTRQVRVPPNVMRAALGKGGPQ